jgi:hypothetical protein
MKLVRCHPPVTCVAGTCPLPNAPPAQ